jgi:oligopeptidase B
MFGGMNRPTPLFLVLAMAVIQGCGSTIQYDAPRPPVARQIPERLETHGRVRIDPYHWLNQRENPEVVAYVEAENDYVAAVMKPAEPLRQEIFREIVARLPQRDESVPVLAEDGYWYYRRFEEGKEYPLFARRKGSLDSGEEVLVDANDLALGAGFFSIEGVKASPDGRLLAFSTDTTGRRIYTLRFKDLTTGELLSDLIPEVTGNVAWANDGRTLFYVRQHPETLRWFQVWRHRVGTAAESDVLIYEEKDETFDVTVFRTKSGRFIVAHSSQTITDEARILDAGEPEGEFRVFEPRRRGHEYSIDHAGDSFYIRTNDGARNFRMMKTPVAATARSNWTESVAQRDDTFIEEFEVFPNHLALLVRRNALTQMEVVPLDGTPAHAIAFDEPAYVVRLGQMETLQAPLRFVYTSLTTPDSTFDYDLRTGERVLRKQQAVGGGFDPSKYATERIFAPARDGRMVPVSLLYRKGTQRDASSPLLLYGYGSYGISSDPQFSTAVFSLVDRGFVYAIAHIRGGQELGREWYDEGKLLRKKNTFTDFIDTAEFLIEQRYADPKNVFAAGGSAGGLLIGAVVNMRPDLWKGVLARVPFVDVVTTMLDDSIPLTTAEYDEWGNPNDPVYFDYMLSYSPYDQIQPKAYPNILITTGFHDAQVQYFEPAKWVAKLRATKTDSNLLLLRTYMEAGHGGASGRFRRQEETALAYAFFLSLSAR